MRLVWSILLSKLLCWASQGHEYKPMRSGLVCQVCGKVEK